jgi:hypothetical protein
MHLIERNTLRVTSGNMSGDCFTPISLRAISEETKHMKLGGLIWIMLATTMAGIAIIPIVATPSLAEQSVFLIPVAALAAAIIAIPLSILIAKKIRAQTKLGA